MDLRRYLNVNHQPFQRPVPADWHQRGDEHRPNPRGEDARGQEAGRQHRGRGGARRGPPAQDRDRPGQPGD